MSNDNTPKDTSAISRRKFLKTLGLATAGTIAAPYILPGGSLFAKTANKKVGHVVFCMLAGGIRNIESVQQDLGNLFPYLLNGTKSDAEGLRTTPTLNQQPLQNFGTLYRNFRYAQGPTGHFNGHTVAMTGVYTDTGLNLRQPPEFPTVFEYYRKHNSPNDTPLNAWWISDTLGPYPALNYSRYPGYGPQYAANFISPTTFFGPDGFEYLGDPKFFHEEERARASQVRQFLNKNFDTSTGFSDQFGVVNSPEDAEQLKQFVQESFDFMKSGQFNDPLGFPMNQINGDIYTVYWAERLLQQFQPELTVLNMTASDVAHRDFTGYMNNMMIADYCVGHLWNTIQSTPGLADDTVLIIAPEHGRNLKGNGLFDVYGREANDHTSDDTSREIFCMVLGPNNVVRQNQLIDDVTGESIDIVPTIAHLLGFDTELPGSIINGRVLTEALV
ncbi:MAG: twin-arginine translocation signal domain-containing protein [Bacteroidota bacterium]